MGDERERSRQFGFVGFRTEEQAAEALRYFNNTFVDTARLRVEFALPVAHASLPRAWSKYTKGTSGYARREAKKHESERAARALEDGQAARPLLARAAKRLAAQRRRARAPDAAAADDPKLAEFLELMRPRGEQALWADDGRAAAGEGARRGGHPAVASASTQAVESRKTGGRGVMLNRTHITFKDDEEGLQFDDAAGGDGSDDEMYEENAGAGDNGGDGDGNGTDAAGGEPDAMVMDDDVDDLAYLRSRVRKGEGASTAAGDDASSSDDDSDDDSDGSGSDSDGSADGADDSEATGADCGGGQPAATPSGEGDGGAEIDYNALMQGGGQGAEGGADQAQDGTGGGAADPSAEELAATSGRVMVRNLAYCTTEEDLTALFSPHGELTEVHLVRDRRTRQSRGFAYVLYMIPECAPKAAEALNGAIFQGRLISIVPALPSNRNGAAAAAAAGLGGDDDGDGKGAAEAGGGAGKAAPNTSTFKAQREEERRKGAGRGEDAVAAAKGALFMRADTVAQGAAAHLGVTKRDLLDVEGDDAAVRLALGEVHAVAETKATLRAAGVDVDRLEAAAGRNDPTALLPSAGASRCLLVKNLPFECDEAELEQLFGKKAPVTRVVLPRSRALAIVEYATAADAKGAFKALAYRRFKASPLYLQWVPDGVVGEPPKDGEGEGSGGGGGGVEGTTAARDKAAKRQAVEKATTAAAEDGAGGDADGAQEADADADAEACVLYVKNLSFKTGDEALRKHFSKGARKVRDSLRHASVARKRRGEGKVGADGGDGITLGYGFVEFATAAAAREAAAKLDGSKLDGHTLSVAVSRARATGGNAVKGSDGAKRKGKFTKVIVRNVAFEATRKDLQTLLSPFGHLRSLRLPKKFDGSHRGFAFAEFVTSAEAAAAVEALRSAHLYGRHLVIEPAKADEGVDQITKRAADRLVGGAADDVRARKKAKRDGQAGSTGRGSGKAGAATGRHSVFE